MAEVKATVSIPSNFLTIQGFVGESFFCLKPEVQGWLNEHHIDYNLIAADPYRIEFFDIKLALLFKLAMGQWESLPPLYDPVILPLIRRIMPNVIAQSILGVQPMTGPVSDIFRLRTRYEDSADDTN